MCQRHVNISKMETTTKVLPNSLSELTSMTDENVREKLNDMNRTMPIKYKLWMKKDVKYNIILSKTCSGGGH